MNYICAVWNKPGGCWESTYGANKGFGAGGLGITKPHFKSPTKRETCGLLLNLTEVKSYQNKTKNKQTHVFMGKIEILHCL